MTIKDLVQTFSSLTKSANFFEDYYQQQFLKFSGKKIHVSHLFDDRDLKAAIQFMPEHSERLVLIFHGIGMSLDKIKKDGVVQFDKLTRQHHGGATMIFNTLGSHSNRLYLFNKYLESIFDGRVHTNFYGTPRNSRGFKPHSDGHDVLVLQLKGSKDWSFYKTKEKVLKIKKAFSDDEIELTDEIRMEAGDLMYVPRGLLHAAKATHELSWHLTIGITGHYWGDMMKEMIEQNVSLQQRLRKVVPKEMSEDEVKHTITGILKNTDFAFSLEKARAKFDDRFPNLGKNLDQIKVVDQNQLERLNGEMLFCSEKEDMKVSSDSKAIILDLTYREKSLELHLRLKDAIDQITTRTSFMANELKGLKGSEEQLLLVYYLWNNGFIRPLKND